MKNEVLIFGHKNPDTDTICSSMVKEILNKKEGCEKSRAVRLGNVNKETQYVLNYLELEAPELIEKVEEDQEVLLVDHNEFNQSVDGIEEADILEVIDHHKLGALSTSYPINFRNMAVGSTNTIIHLIYEENNFPIPKPIAGIMLSGIISDTLLLKSPTTTLLDKNAVMRLSKIAGVDYEKYGIEMFKAGSSIKGKSLEEILFSDFKVFKVGNIEAGIGQIFTTDYSSLKIDINKFEELLNNTSKNNDYLVVCLFITDIMCLEKLIKIRIVGFLERLTAQKTCFRTRIRWR